MAGILKNKIAEEFAACKKGQSGIPKPSVLGRSRFLREDPLLAALYAEIEVRPEDLFNLQALADWFEDRNQTRIVEPLRWLITERKCPFRYTKETNLLHHYDGWKSGWYWWATDREGRDWRHPASCTLPHERWMKLRHTFDYKPLVFREYPTVRAAIEAFIDGWARKRAWYKRAPKTTNP